jgi:hypothetical protein
MRAKLWALGCGLSTVLVATVAEAKHYDVSASGHLIYQETDGSWHPMANVRVRLLHDDFDLKHEMGTATTDANGNFNISGRTGLLQIGKPSPYVQFVLEKDGRVDVRDLIGFSHRCNSGKKNHTDGHINFGTMSMDHNRSLLYVRANQQYDYFQQHVGGEIPSHGGTIGVIYPAVLDAGVPYTTEESIHWPGKYTNYNAAYHEWGHRIRHAADGSFFHFLGDVLHYTYLQQHWYYKQTNAGFAFNEGWAEYHSTLLDPNERNNFHAWHYVAPTGNQPTEAIEGNVAADLLKLSDECGGFKALWTTLRNAGEHKVHSLSEFYSRFIHEHPTCKVPLTHVGPSGHANTAQHPATPPVAHDVVSLQDQVAHLKKELDDIFQRGAVPVQHSAHTAPKNLEGKRSQAHDNSQAAARDALRKHILGIKPATVQSLADGSHAKDVDAARANYTEQVAKERIAQLEQLKAEVAKERAAAKDAETREYLESVAARYEKEEQELKELLKNKGNGNTKMPESLYPNSGVETTTQH